jgi:hypothetical protein
MTTVRESLEVLLERIRVEYNHYGSLNPFIAYRLNGEEPVILPGIAYNDGFDRNNPNVLEWAVTKEDDEFVYFEYHAPKCGIIFSAEKDLLEGGYLKKWVATTLDLSAIVTKSKENQMLPSKEDIVKQVQETIERKDWSRQAVKVMKKSSDAVLARVQQNIAAQLKEDTAPIIQNFVINLSRSLMDATANFLEKSRDATVDLPVFPIGTRYIKQDGNVLNVVIEQPPQARTLFFTREAAAAFDKNVGNGRTQSYYLALPYTIFVMQFINGQYSGELNVFWRSRPLAAINDELALMPFPNISGGKVCLGEFRPNVQNKKVDDQCNEVISGFWQTVFGNDYVDRVSKFLALNRDMTIQQWVAKSKKNPLCAMDFKLQPANVKLQQTFRVDGQNNLVALLKQHILTAVGQIGGEVQKLLVDLDVTGENREKVHLETMSEIIKETIVLAYAELWQQLSIKLEKERAADAEKNRITKDRMKAEFMEWVRSTYPQLQKSTW